jgi:hypothetical protein
MLPGPGLSLTAAATVHEKTAGLRQNVRLQERGWMKSRVFLPRKIEVGVRLGEGTLMSLTANVTANDPPFLHHTIMK